MEYPYYTNIDATITGVLLLGRYQLEEYSLTTPINLTALEPKLQLIVCWDDNGYPSFFFSILQYQNNNKKEGTTDCTWYFYQTNCNSVLMLVLMFDNDIIDDNIYNITKYWDRRSILNIVVEN